MADDPLLIAVRVEKRAIAMRPVIAAILESVRVAILRLDVAEVEPQNPDKIEIADRVRSVVNGLVETSKEKQSAILWVQVALSRLTFGDDPVYPPRDIDIAIIAAASHFSPMILSVRADPSADVPKPILAWLRQIEINMRKELPKFETPNWQSSMELSHAVTETLFAALFNVASIALGKYDDEVLQ